MKKIPVRILKKSSFGYYVIKISGKYKDKNIKFKCGDEYVVDTKLLKKIKEKTWKAIVLNNEL